MARVVTKKSTVPGKVPLAADLEIGELAVNTADAKLFTKHSDNTIKQLGGDAASSYFRTEPIAATASGQTSFTVPGGYTPGAIFVSLNGATLPPADFTATDGTTVVLASGEGVVAGSVLLVHVLSAFEVADALPLGGTAFDSARYAGLLPPPNDGKTYALSGGAWVEVEGGGGGIWGSITGTLADQTDIASALAAKASASDIDFTIIYPNGGSAESPATIAVNTRLPVDNPYPGFYVDCVAEVFYGGIWGPSFSSASTEARGFGVAAHQASAGDIIVQSGSQGTFQASNLSGGPHGYTGSGITNPIPFRVKVRKIKGEVA